MQSQRRRAARVQGASRQPGKNVQYGPEGVCPWNHWAERDGEMKILFKALYDFVVDQFTLFENPFWNYVIAAIVGTIAFSIAWNLVGRLYDAGDIHGGGCG